MVEITEIIDRIGSIDVIMGTIGVTTDVAIGATTEATTEAITEETTVVLATSRNR